MNLAVLAERNVETFGEYESLFFEGRAHTNLEQLHGAHRLAGALREMGVTPGDRVAVMMPNGVEVGQAYVGISAAGGVVVPIVFLLTVPEIHHILADARPSVIVTGPDFVSVVHDAISGLPEPPTVVVTGSVAPEEMRAWNDVVGPQPDAFEPVDRNDDDLAVIMYTGGTTGRPKGVMITHGNLLWMAQTLATETTVGPEDVGLMALPVSHLFGMIAGITGQVLGTRGVLLRWFEAGDVLKAIERYRVTSIPMVPTMALFLLQHPDVAVTDTSSLRTVLLSAAPVPIELKRRFGEVFGCEVLEAYGQTEASPAIAIEREGEEHRPGSCGRAIAGVEVVVLDEDGAEQPRGEVGEICVRSPGVMKGYYGLPEATSETLVGGWLHTGDLGYLDADGYLYVTDRKRDLVIRGGFNVYPRDVEDLLYRHPAVAEAAVVGRPDPVMGEEVVAFVVVRPGSDVTEDDLLAFCQRELATYERPKEILFVPALPTSPIGKVLKKELRSRLVAREDGATRRRVRDRP